MKSDVMKLAWQNFRRLKRLAGKDQLMDAWSFSLKQAWRTLRATPQQLRADEIRRELLILDCMTDVYDGDCPDRKRLMAELVELEPRPLAA